MAIVKDRGKYFFVVMFHVDWWGVRGIIHYTSQSPPIHKGNRLYIQNSIKAGALVSHKHQCWISSINVNVK